MGAAKLATRLRRLASRTAPRLQALLGEPLGRQGGIEEALGLSGDEEGAGEGPWQRVRGRVLGPGGMVSW